MDRKTIEEYLETIFLLEKKEGSARTKTIASEMNITPPSVTEMLRKLQKERFIHYEPYKGATLAPRGETIACELMKTHKIVADFLKIVGVESEVAERDACMIEHHVTPHTIAQLEKFVGFVRDSPHDPRWLQHFEYFSKTGKRAICCDINNSGSMTSIVLK